VSEADLANAAALWSRLAIAAGGEALSLDGALAIINPARPRLAEANRVVAESRDGAFDAHRIAGILAAKGIARATCDVVGAGELLRERLESEGYEPERLLPVALVENDLAAALPDGCLVEAVEQERDRFAWEQIEAEVLAERDEPPAISADLSAWLRAAGASLWLATMSGAPAGAAALFVHGGQALVARLTERPALRRRGVGDAMLRELRQAASSTRAAGAAGAGALHHEVAAFPGMAVREPPVEPMPWARGSGVSTRDAVATVSDLLTPPEAGTILRFEIRCD